jgi:hypothetical protein
MLETVFDRLIGAELNLPISKFALSFPRYHLLESHFLIIFTPGVR